MSKFENLIMDLSKTISMWRYWLYSAFIKLQQKHAKTSFKFFWEPMSILFVATILSIVWSKVLDVADPREYFLYLITGLLVWTLLSDLSRQGVASLRSNARNMTIRPLALSTYIAEDISFCLLSFLISLPFVFVLVAIFGSISFQGVFWFFIGLLLILIAAFGFALSFGVAAFYMGDVQQLVYAVMRLGFLVTPVIWKPERLGEYAHLVWLNPFFSFLDVCRRGLLSQPMDSISFGVASGIAFALLVVGLTSLFLFSHRIRQWAFQY